MTTATLVLQEYVIPSLGGAISVLVFISSVPALYKARKRKDLGEINPIPFVGILGNTVCQVIYAIISDSNPYLFFPNFVGLLISSWLTIIAYGIVKREKLKLFMEILLELELLVAGLSAFIASKITDFSVRKTFYGIVCIVILCLFYFSPLTTLYEVIKKKDASTLSTPLTVTLTVNCCLWLSYGFYLADRAIYIPNVLGLLFCVIQIIAILLYKRKNRPSSIFKKEVSGKDPENIDLRFNYIYI
ncbi:uncharacterized protein LOC135145415 [Zophobas morio]|uniref:uncharacterized protein LOC135145415 n=1 Tax=Zophobas morio TaxID=2755281 RepID=UPI0030835413